MSISRSYFALTSGLWLVQVAQGLVRFYRPECSAVVALYSERSHYTFASLYLASQHLYRLELHDVGSTSN